MRPIRHLILALALGLSLSQNVFAKAVEGVVNVNTATEQELTLLPGVGPAKAKEIVALRQSKPLASVDELKAVKGLGPKSLEALKPHVTFSGATTAKAIKTPKTEAAPTPAAPTTTP